MAKPSKTTKTSKTSKPAKGAKPTKTILPKVARTLARKAKAKADAQAKPAPITSAIDAAEARREQAHAIAARTSRVGLNIADDVLIMMDKASEHPEHCLIPPAGYSETRCRQIARYLSERRLATLLYASTSAAIQPTWCRTSKGRDQILKLTTQGMELLGYGEPAKAPQDAPQAPAGADAPATVEDAPQAPAAGQDEPAAGEISISIAAPELAEQPEAQANAASWPSTRRAPGEHRAGSKIARAIEILKGERGATVAELAQEFGWLPHTTRAFISATLAKKQGLPVTSAKEGERGRVYRIAA